MTKPGDCKEIFAALSAYLDRELTAESCAEIERHIEGCEPCVRFIDSLKRSIALCRQFAPEVMPDSMPPEMKQRLLEAYRNGLASRQNAR